MKNSNQKTDVYDKILEISAKVRRDPRSEYAREIKAAKHQDDVLAIHARHTEGKVSR